MYRDDLCAVCGESLPPDHLYCREHAAIVDDLLHEVGERLPRVVEDLERLAWLVQAIAPETWDFLAEDHPDDPLWPPSPTTTLRADGGEVDVDVDSEPGMVTVSVRLGLAETLKAVGAALATADVAAMAAAAADAEDAGATH